MASIVTVFPYRTGTVGIPAFASPRLSSISIINSRNMDHKNVKWARRHNPKSFLCDKETDNPINGTAAEITLAQATFFMTHIFFRIGV